MNVKKEKRGKVCHVLVVWGVLSPCYGCVAKNACKCAPIASFIHCICVLTIDLMYLPPYFTIEFIVLNSTADRSLHVFVFSTSVKLGCLFFTLHFKDIILLVQHEHAHLPKQNRPFHSLSVFLLPTCLFSPISRPFLHSSTICSHINWYIITKDCKVNQTNSSSNELYIWILTALLFTALFYSSLPTSNTSQYTLNALSFLPNLAEKDLIGSGSFRQI